MANVLKLVSHRKIREPREWKLKIPHFIKHDWDRWDLIGGGWQARRCKACGVYKKEYVGVQYKEKE